MYLNALAYSIFIFKAYLESLSGSPHSGKRHFPRLKEPLDVTEVAFSAGTQTADFTAAVSAADADTDADTDDVVAVWHDSKKLFQKL